MTGMDLARLREVAEAATEGPWAWEAVSTNDNGWCLGVVWDENDQPLSGRVEDGEGDVVDQVCELMFASHFRDAEHIATFDPPTVLALLDTLAEQAATIARVEALAADPAVLDAVSSAHFEAWSLNTADANGWDDMPAHNRGMAQATVDAFVAAIRADLRPDPSEANDG